MVKEVKLWVDNYCTLCDEGLMRSRKNESFTFEYKLHVVKLYLTSEVSYQKLALQEGIQINYSESAEIVSVDTIAEHVKQLED